MALPNVFIRRAIVLRKVNDSEGVFATHCGVANWQGGQEWGYAKVRLEELPGQVMKVSQ